MIHMKMQSLRLCLCARKS